jgi:hypothetical protein
VSFNDDQIDYMKYLATVPAAEKCYCGWYMANGCPNCKGRGTLADRLKVQCPDPRCRNYPHLGGKPTITHNIKCSTPDWQPSSLTSTKCGGARE